jgi:hypothetical protein
MTSEDPGADGVSPTAAFQHGKMHLPIEALHHLPDHHWRTGTCWRLSLPARQTFSTVFPHAGTSGTIPTSWATLEASTHVVSLKNEGVGGSGWATNRRNFRAPKVSFLLKNHRIPSSDTRGDKL